jgi:hypothetical protein
MQTGQRQKWNFHRRTFPGLQRFGFELEFAATRLAITLPMLLRRHRLTNASDSAIFSDPFFDVMVEQCALAHVGTPIDGLCSHPELITRALRPSEAGAAHRSVVSWLRRGALDARHVRGGNWSYARTYLHVTAEIDLDNVARLLARVGGFALIERTRHPRDAAAATRLHRTLALVNRVCAPVSLAYCGLLALVSHVAFEVTMPQNATAPRMRPKYVFDYRRHHSLPLMVRSHFGDLYGAVQRAHAAPLQPMMLRHLGEIMGSAATARIDARVYPFPLKPYGNARPGQATMPLRFWEVAQRLAAGDGTTITTQVEAYRWAAAHPHRMRTSIVNTRGRDTVRLPEWLTPRAWVSAMADGRDLLSDWDRPPTMPPMPSNKTHLFNAMGAWRENGTTTHLEFRFTRDSLRSRQEVEDASWRAVALLAGTDAMAPLPARPREA